MEGPDAQCHAAFSLPTSWIFSGGGGGGGLGADCGGNHSNSDGVKEIVLAAAPFCTGFCYLGCSGMTNLAPNGEANLMPASL